MKPVAFIAVFIFSICNTIVFAQQIVEKKPVSFSFNVSLSDYSFCKEVKDSSLAKAFRQKDWLKPADKSFGIGVSYWNGLTKHIDFSGTFTGTFSDFPANFVKSDSIGQAAFTTQLDALLHFRMFKDDAKVNPFLTCGIGIGYFYKQAAAYAPVGAGLQFRFREGNFMVVQVQWRKALMDGITNDYLMYSIGFMQGAKPMRQSRKEVSKKEPPVIPSIADTIKPAIANSVKDSISTKENNFSNFKDTDKIKVVPVIKAEVKQKVDMAVKRIFFGFASDVILEISYRALDDVVDILKQDTLIKVKIEAHSDNRGLYERNMYWSEQRAKAVAYYFTTKGIAARRIEFKGYGDTRPIADNNTEIGRAKNRRVEIRLYY